MQTPFHGRARMRDPRGDLPDPARLALMESSIAEAVAAGIVLDPAWSRLAAAWEGILPRDSIRLYSSHRLFFLTLKYPYI